MEIVKQNSLIRSQSVMSVAHTCAQEFTKLLQNYLVKIRSRAHNCYSGKIAAFVYGSQLLTVLNEWGRCERLATIERLSSLNQPKQRGGDFDKVEFVKAL